MHIHHIGNTPSVLSQFIREIRDEDIQKDRMRFRRNLERIGEVLAYEMSKSLSYHRVDVRTPLGLKEMPVAGEDIVICSVLRAGVPLHIGVLNYFDAADNAFISAYREHLPEGGFRIIVEYAATPSLEAKTVLLTDPMLATGQSLVSTYKSLLRFGNPTTWHIISVIGSREGVEYVGKHFPEDTHLWIAAVDDTLNDKGYIVPGLGDAGDLAFGTKL